MTTILQLILLIFLGSSPTRQKSELRLVYEKLGLEKKLEYEVFEYAVNGFNSIDNKQNGAILTIIDFSKPSDSKRLYVLNMKKKELVYHTLVAHGKNSGENYATSFSNKSRSLKSCLGFFLTAETYHGKHGYSLKLDGLENGINDNARKRAIVIHGAWYVNDEFAKKHGRLGRSWGCPALPFELTKEIIDLIKDGSCLFIYGKDPEYKKHSKLIG